MAEKISDIVKNINNIEHQGALINLFLKVLGLAPDSREGNVNFGSNGHVGIDSIKFNLDTTVPEHLEGQMHWDAGNNTLSIGMTGGTVELQVGQEHLIYCFNQTGSPIPNGSCVYVDDAGDSKVRIDLADADNTTPIPDGVVVGLATESIAHGSSGFVTTQGLVRDVNTQGITEGVPLWLSDSTPGAFVETEPQAPSIRVAIGYCIYAHVNNGIILVNPIITPKVTGLSDVFGTPSNGDTIRWSDANDRFEFGA